MPSHYPILESLVGYTPLICLQRLSGRGRNTILGKLEGNNPAGSVRDRPALSMIRHAEARGEIQPGDTLLAIKLFAKNPRSVTGRSDYGY